MNCVVRNSVLFGAIFLFSACAPKEYVKDSQAIDAPAEKTQMVTLPAFPEKGRQFEIRRTYLTTSSSRGNRRTPPEGHLETLKVADKNGTLQFWRQGNLIHTIRLGKCFSFAMMDENHDFAARGAPAYFTAPPDCKVWSGRKWHQTYRTVTTTRTLPCVYEAKRSAAVTGSGNARLIRSGTQIHMTEERDGSTKDWSNWVEYDVSQRFFKKFNVGYVGKVEILREIK